MTKYNPSIEFLELIALTIAVLTWTQEPELGNGRVTIFCDNKAVVHMINNTASSCRQCRKLIWILVKDGIRRNRRLFCKHIKTSENILSDALSRLDYPRFWRHAQPTMKSLPDHPDQRLWPLEKIWRDDTAHYLSQF